MSETYGEKDKLFARPFHPYRVPNSELDSLVFDFQVLDFEIDPNGGLNVLVKAVVRESQQNGRLYASG